MEEVGKAHPRIVETVENMLKKGKWTVPGEFRPSFAFFNAHPLLLCRIQGEIRRPIPYVNVGVLHTAIIDSGGT